MIHNSRGFSLVSVMVAAGIAGGVALLIMQLSGNLKTVETRSEGVTEAREMLVEMKTLLTSELHCRAGLKGLTFRKEEIDDPLKESGIPFEFWMAHPESGERLKRKFHPGQVLGKTGIKSIQLFMDNGTYGNYPAGATSDLGTVRITYGFNGGQRTLKREFMVTLSLATDERGNSSILGCERLSVKALCESLGMDYSAEGRRCLNPKEECDDWKEVAPMGPWFGWRKESCGRRPGGYVQSLLFGQSHDASDDRNHLKIKCCYSKKYDFGDCGKVDVAPEEWWTGNKEGLCTLKSRGFIRGVEFYQGRSQGNDTNGMRIECCYPN